MLPNLLALLALGVAAQALSPYVLHEKRSQLPSGWSLARRFDASEVLPLRFALKQSNLEKLDEFLHDVSHPDSPNYGQHWTPAQIAETFAPSSKTIDTVHSWLVGAGVDASRLQISPSKVWIHLNATVEEAERLLKTQYNIYRHKSGAKHIACESYHLPGHVSPHVDFVSPSIHFDAIVEKRDGSSVPARKIGMPGVGISPKTTGTVKQLFTDLENCDKTITPVCLRALYGLVYQPLSPQKNSYGIVEYTPQAYVQSDLDLFNNEYSKALVGKSPNVVSIAGGVVQTTQTGFNFNGESNLDIQYGWNLVNLVGSKQEVTLYQVGDLTQGASFNNFLDALDGDYCSFEGGDDPSQDANYPGNCGTVKPANVISTSYGYNEADLSPFYTERQCAEYGKLGMMGVTVVFSTGDNGVAGNGDVCLNADGSQSASGTRFNPTFPAGCPYVTAVGATQVNPGSKVTDPESACQQVIFSGGGFSNYFPIPNYQKDAVQKYLSKHKPTYPASVWNSTGISRGYPDIAANGANYAVAVDGEFDLVYGTSASAPVVGAILTMINDARITLGKKPIGFINPAIYSDFFAGAFNDITSGGNPGCGTAGYTAVPGWDPVTGLGTPSFPKLVARWLLLP